MTDHPDPNPRSDPTTDENEEIYPRDEEAMPHSESEETKDVKKKSSEEFLPDPQQERNEKTGAALCHDRYANSSQQL